MRILKNAEQANVIVNKDFYTLAQINDMLEKKIIFYFDESYNEQHEELWTMNNVDLRVFTCNCKDIKVVCKDGQYMNVVTTLDGLEIFVTL